MDNSVYVLDSFALMAHFGGENGGKKVLELLEQAEAGKGTLAMSLINVGEMAYLMSRERGRNTAESMLEDLRLLPISFFDATEERILAAAWIKSEYSVSYADSFAISLAKELNATLVSGDPEFRAVEKIVPVLWLEK
ncbi:MAG: type II toxin-antitoxin system VapC family toxin [Chloroflexi bacterium]|nr:type II toxin-antitoxin system VapC family toxin [Chloroflexota bacterium]